MEWENKIKTSQVPTQQTDLNIREPVGNELLRKKTVWRTRSKALFKSK